MKILDHASRRALIANAHNGHMFVGCFVLDSRRNVIARGINVYNIDKHSRSIHAEHNAMIALNNYIRRKHGNHPSRRKRVTVVVYRTNKRGKILMNAKPCTDCVNIMFGDQRIYKLARVYYTTQTGAIEHL